ncbi:MAG: ABC transporter ATP-binding protein [Bacillota bacterium]|nr:ABC transporter ATP-binding protein [Bacillota bacterium]
MNTLEVNGLYKSYGRKLAVNNLNFQVGPGKIVGLLGPNGCGKTTTMKIVTGLIQDFTGDVKITGMPISVESKAIVSFLPEKTYLSDWMKPSYAFDYFSDFYTDFDKSKAYELLNHMGISPDQKIKTMSKGMQEKLQLVLVMSRAAKLYILDEPLSGVDPATRAYILDTILKNYNEESSILMSTHLIYDVERIFDDVVMMKDGTAVIADTVDNIRERTGKSVEEYFKEVFAYVW